MGGCFACEGAGSERYTMILNDETMLEDVVMCESCHGSYDTVEWIEILDAPVLMRGTDDGKTENSME